jgi:hypothetical protein
VHGLSQTLKEAVNVVSTADLVNGEIGFAILAGLATGNVRIINPPSKFLAPVTDTPS